MAEYLIQDTTLTGIADAIREKTGGTDAIMVSAMASAIASITTGSGDSSGGSAEEWICSSGSFTPTSTTKTIAHGLGVVPDVVIMWAQVIKSGVSTTSLTALTAIGVSQAFGDSISPVSDEASMIYGVSFAVQTSNDYLFASSVTQGIDTLPDSYAPAIKGATASTVKFGSSTMALNTGFTYKWVALARKSYSATG